MSWRASSLLEIAFVSKILSSLFSKCRRKVEFRVFLDQKWFARRLFDYRFRAIKVARARLEVACWSHPVPDLALGNPSVLTRFVCDLATSIDFRKRASLCYLSAQLPEKHVLTKDSNTFDDRSFVVLFHDRPLFGSWGRSNSVSSSTLLNNWNLRERVKALEPASMIPLEVCSSRARNPSRFLPHEQKIVPTFAFF